MCAIRRAEIVVLIAYTHRILTPLLTDLPIPRPPIPPISPISTRLDQDTAAMGLDFSVYNTNTRYLTIFRTVFEFQVSGNVVCSYEISSTPMLWFQSNSDIFRLVAEVVFAFILFVRFISWIYLVRRERGEGARSEARDDPTVSERQRSYLLCVCACGVSCVCVCERERERERGRE